MKKLKEVLKKLFKEKVSVIFGLIIGVIVMGGISYGVNQIQSSSVSYTRDGKTMSVEEALDDVINKSLSQINALKSEKTDLTTFKNSIIESFKETGIGAYYLADVVSIGDYVAYDAGSWTSTASNPTSHGNFGGYTAGQNKANSVVCHGPTSLKGWRVFSIDTSNKIVTLVHAGQPECYYHTYGGNESVSNLNNRAASTYLNSAYAQSAHMMNYDEALAIAGNKAATDNNLRTTGAYYWLATVESFNSINEVLRVTYTGEIHNDSDRSFGVRPVVILKSNILTTGMGKDAVGQSAWTLVKP